MFFFLFGFFTLGVMKLTSDAKELVILIIFFFQNSLFGNRVGFHNRPTYLCIACLVIIVYKPLAVIYKK